MKKTFLAALAAPALVMGLAFSSGASAHPSGPPKYTGDAEGQLAWQNYQQQLDQQRYGYGGYGYGVPTWERDRPYWHRGGRQAAPRGYQWQRYGDRDVLVRRSDGAIVQWR